MQLLAKHHNTIEDYFSVEESSQIKHEFFNGEIFAMAGASLRHNRICRNLFALLNNALEETDCEVFVNDLRLKTPNELYTYPDLMVICNEINLSETDRLDTVLNPNVSIEVLSNSTAKYDRNEKFAFYRQIESLQEYLLVEQNKILIEKYTLEDAENRTSLDSWRKEVFTDKNDFVSFESINVKLRVEKIYQKVGLLQV